MSVGIPERQELGAPQECPESAGVGLFWEQSDDYEETISTPGLGGTLEIGRTDLSGVANNSIVMTIANMVWMGNDGIDYVMGWAFWMFAKNNAGAVQEGLGSGSEIANATNGLSAPEDGTVDGQEAIINYQDLATPGSLRIRVQTFACPVENFQLQTKVYP